MARRSSIYAAPSTLTRAYQCSLKALTKSALRSGTRIAGEAARATTKLLKPPRGPGDWLAGLAGLAGVAIGPGGARRYHLYRPPDLRHSQWRELVNATDQRDRLTILQVRQQRVRLGERWLMVASCPVLATGDSGAKDRSMPHC
jgi:hypothetical protein